MQGRNARGARQSGWVLQSLLVLLVLAISAGAAVWMISSRKTVEAEPVEIRPPLVEVVRAAASDEALVVRSLGQLVPRREASLSSEVSGRVRSVADAFVAGQAVREGEVLLELDTQMLEVAVRSAEASAAQMEAAATQVKAEAERAVQEWKQSGHAGDPPPLVARKPAIAEADARIAAATAALDQARLDLERAKLRAPFHGYLRDVSVGLGEYVQQGRVLATLYQAEPMELRVSLTDRELARLDLEQLFGAATELPAVQVTTSFAGRKTVWSGRVARVDGEVDPVSRMVRLVCEVSARVPDAAQPRGPRAPLFAGVYADCAIEGRTVADAIVLPRAAMYEPGLVLVVGEEGRLERREVVLAMSDRETITLESGLSAGEQVIVSPLDAAIDGMFVRIRSDIE